jgi:hypothetical protein
MKEFIVLLIFSMAIGSCGTKQPKPNNIVPGKTGPEKIEPAQAPPANQPTMWKITSYAGDLGDNKNSNYMTNAFAIWGTFSNSSVDNGEIKVKFLIDKVSFCIKLYEYGNNVVKKGDETVYNITLKSEGIEPVQFMAKNVSDRIFINQVDEKKLVELFDTGAKIIFSMVNDSKSNPTSYAFALDRPGKFSETLKQLSK